MVESRLSLEDIAVLDLFAGSGALGLEAISRGAKHAVFVERSAKCCRTIAHNAEALGWAELCRVYRGSVADALGSLAAEGLQFALITMDPPYDSDCWSVVRQGGVARLLEAEGLLVVEHSSHVEPPTRIGVLANELTRCYGDSALSLWCQCSSTLSQ